MNTIELGRALKQLRLSGMADVLDTRLIQAQTEEPAFTPLPEVKSPPATGSMNWLLAGGVLAFLAIAGIFLYFSNSDGGSAPTSSLY